MDSCGRSRPWAREAGREGGRKGRMLLLTLLAFLPSMGDTPDCLPYICHWIASMLYPLQFSRLPSHDWVHPFKQVYLSLLRPLRAPWVLICLSWKHTLRFIRSFSRCLSFCFISVRRAWNSTEVPTNVPTRFKSIVCPDISRIDSHPAQAEACLYLSKKKWNWPSCK